MKMDLTEFLNELEKLYDQLKAEQQMNETINLMMNVIVPIIMLIVIIVIAVKINKLKKQRDEEIEYFKKAINEIQNITSRQQEIIGVIRETNNELYKNTSVLKTIQKQTLPNNAQEQEELKKKLEELNKLIK